MTKKLTFTHNNKTFDIDKLEEVFEDIISKGIIKHAKTHFINSTIDIKDKIASENGTVNIYLADGKVNYEFIGFSKNLVDEIKSKMLS